MSRMTKRLPGLLLLSIAFVAPAMAAPQKVELKKLSDQIGVLESVLNQSIAQKFGGPFGILDKARGAYLPGYGVAIDFEVNLSPNPPLGPFASIPNARQIQQRHQTEQLRRKQAMELAQHVLSEYGHTLSALAANESVAIVIHTVALGDEGLERSVIVVQASKKSIDELHANAIDRAAFVHKLDVVEY